MEITEEWGVVVALQRVCALVCVLLFVAWISACSSRVPMDRDMVFSIVFFLGGIYMIYKCLPGGLEGLQSQKQREIWRVLAHWRFRGGIHGCMAWYAGMILSRLLLLFSLNQVYLCEFHRFQVSLQSLFSAH